MKMSESKEFPPAKNIRTLGALMKRHFIVYFRNWQTVLFTMMVPLVIVLVYILFLRPLETSLVEAEIANYIAAENITDELLDLICGLVDSWMISGIMAVSCITVSLNINTLMVRDKETGITKDFLSSPIPSTTIMISYFVFNFCVTSLINMVVLFVSLIYLACSGAVMINVSSFFALIGILLLSAFASALLTFFICNFISKESVLAAVVAIFSAAIGFLVGAYLPTSMLPSGVEALTGFIHGTYSASLFRNFFMSYPIEQMLATGIVTDEVVNSLMSYFSFDIQFFGYTVSPGTQVLVLFVFCAIYLALNLIFTQKYFFKLPKLKKKKKADVTENTEAINNSSPEPDITENISSQSEENAAVEDQNINDIQTPNEGG